DRAGSSTSDRRSPSVGTCFQAGPSTPSSVSRSSLATYSGNELASDPETCRLVVAERKAVATSPSRSSSGTRTRRFGIQVPSEPVGLDLRRSRADPVFWPPGGQTVALEAPGGLREGAEERVDPQA